MKFIQKILTILAIFGTVVSSAQQTNDQILLTIGSEKILRSEFERIYLKNNQVVGEIDRKSVEDYLDLFVNYKLKVIEALNMKLDTTAAFKNELACTADLLERQTGQRPLGYRAPRWSLCRDKTPWAFDILVELGYQYDSSLTPLAAIGNPPPAGEGDRTGRSPDSCAPRAGRSPPLRHWSPAPPDRSPKGPGFPARNRRRSLGSCGGRASLRHPRGSG